MQKLAQKHSRSEKQDLQYECKMIIMKGTIENASISFEPSAVHCYLGAGTLRTVESNVIPYGRADCLGALKCDTLSHSDCTDAPGLRDGNATGGANGFIIQNELRDLRGLTTSFFCYMYKQNIVQLSKTIVHNHINTQSRA